MLGFEGERTPAIESLSEGARDRQNRMVLAPDAGVKSCGGAAAQPGLAASVICKATVAIELVSPGRLRHKPQKPLRVCGTARVARAFSVDFTHGNGALSLRSDPQITSQTPQGGLRRSDTQHRLIPSALFRTHPRIAMVSIHRSPPPLRLSCAEPEFLETLTRDF